MTLSSKPLLLLPLLLVMIYLSACSSGVDIRKLKTEQDQWLEANYPDKPEASPQLPALNTEFYNEVIAGKVVVGMNLLETKVATKTRPHGNKKNNTVYWCDGQLVKQCHNACGICAAVLVSDNNNYYLKGRGNNPQVVQKMAKQAGDDAAYFKSKHYSIVNALFLNKIVSGMNMDDFRRIQLLPGTKQEYYCNKRRIYQSCLGDCGDCVIKIISARGDTTHVQTVHFKGHLDFKTIVDVKESTFSIQK